ncbi:MAG: tryptophan-rich sensory protein [Clostridiaceae bacterium]|jgi:tryptophan-rich sensory protein|nr:tryptophan-rich sensory protein [Clostridiaceae bacterium]
MIAYKRLIGITVAVFFVLIFEWLFSLITVTGSDWYIALDKPSFMLSDGYMTLLRVMVYGFIIALVARLVVKRRFNPDCVFLSCAALLNVLCAFIFFRIHNLPLSLAVMITSTLLHYAALFRFTLKRPSDGIIFLPAVIFISYLLCVLTSVTAMN